MCNQGPLLKRKDGSLLGSVPTLGDPCEQGSEAHRRALIRALRYRGGGGEAKPECVSSPTVSVIRVNKQGFGLKRESYFSWHVETFS